MGNDGHVVSIFPNSNELEITLFANQFLEKNFKRITFLNLINNSQKIFLWLNNKTKIFNIYKKFKRQGIEIPINNINKRKLNCFMIN